MRRGHPYPAGKGCGWKTAARERIDRAAGGPADVGNDHRRQLREMGAILPRLADPH